MIHLGLRVLLPATLLVGFSFWGPDPEWDSIRDYIRKQHPNVESVSPAQLKEMLNDVERSPILLDARERAEFDVSRLPGAILVESPSEVAEHLSSLLSSQSPRPIVVYCSVGVRSARLAEELTDQGFEGVLNLDGSIFAWANQGFPLVREDGPTQLVHPYNRSWGALLQSELWSWGAANAAP